MGIERFLITCDTTNIASEKTILANGGVFECLIDAGDGNMMKRYWISKFTKNNGFLTLRV